MVKMPHFLKGLLQYFPVLHILELLKVNSAADGVFVVEESLD